MDLKRSVSRLFDSLRGNGKPYPAPPERLWWGGTPPADYDPDLSRLVDPSLEDLADAYGSDKGTLGAGHRYTRIYPGLIASLRARRARRALSICEIGVACGASLKMWSHYLPDAEVVGIDVRSECSEVCRDWPNIRIQIGDPRELAVEPDRFDLIVDDASHIAEDIRDHFDHCFAWLRPGGYYVVEDTGCVGDRAYARSVMERFGRSELKNERATFTEMVDAIMRSIDSRSQPAASLAYHPCMLVIEKRDGTEPRDAG